MAMWHGIVKNLEGRHDSNFWQYSKSRPVGFVLSLFAYRSSSIEQALTPCSIL
ncbi:uncharacterized protein AKAW2_21408A [Aspergillus luchuensis]|uniref:Aldehyde dehydrogenase family protein n=1 Tax=Aspergillus kawachii TaxID=1069201 RepID=A0A146FKH0_ASPKA|nr:uncharacterized protein AKAW2_21408A [Aspergillus luchuensis]BCR96468.1 hypothetical protein AKAW2_21408A [Aspergillus luchuensis]GAT26440.1 aldehyde dehydrogenase family protein [Aspergillus luchuensis]